MQRHRIFTLSYRNLPSFQLSLSVEILFKSHRFISKMTEKTYETAIRDLNSLQSNASTIQDLRTSGKNMNLTSLSEMNLYLRRIGYQTEELNRLNIIHVTGTKGKGSTCAFIDSILKRTQLANKERTLKTG